MITPPRDGRDVALVLVGHGSARHPDATRPVLELADDIRVRGRFTAVTAMFMKPEPPMATPERMVPSPTVVIVPVFAGKGYYTDTLIPRIFGLTGRVTRRHGRTLLLTPPVGCHPRIPALLAARARAAAPDLDPASASLLLVAHGSKRPKGAAETPRAVAAALAATGEFGEVAVGFLEQEPKAATWPTLVTRPDVIALPLLVSQGMHASEDIPPLFANPPPGRRVHLATSLGAEPDVVDIIVEMAEAAVAGRG